MDRYVSIVNVFQVFPGVLGRTIKSDPGPFKGIQRKRDYTGNPIWV